MEASIYIWRRRLHSKLISNTNRSAAKSSWEMVKELMVDGDKRGLVVARAESLLLCLKQRFPGLTQTTLDTSKIQCNKVQFPYLEIFCSFSFVWILDEGKAMGNNRKISFRSQFSFLFASQIPPRISKSKHSLTAILPLFHVSPPYHLLEHGFLYP